MAPGCLLAGLRAGSDVQQFVFSSTMLVHKPGEPGIFITEDWPIGPTWAYPESKVRTEAIIAAERGNVPTVMLRFAGVYDDGCHSPPWPIRYSGSTNASLNRIFTPAQHRMARPMSTWTTQWTRLPAPWNAAPVLAAETVILIGEPDTLSYDELQHSFMRQIHDESYEEFSVPGPIAKIGAWVEGNILGQKPFIKPWMIDRANDHYALDPSRAKKLLGWVPKHSLRKTIPKMVAALKANPLAFYRENGLEPTEWMLANAEAAKQQEQRR
ncbi:NAD-dependent epimerase/dehydratase family protein (plasmid) [Mesorhizobium atlanticum]|uniref:NAD-dependent epimerase/dehydratase family protein n=1 Tax=Mesorhizobium atlanticum TaxID=2233532 RepID=UPI003703FC09